MARDPVALQPPPNQPATVLTRFPRTWSEHFTGGGCALDAVPQQVFDVSRIPVEAPEDAMPGRVESDRQRLDEADQLCLVRTPLGALLTDDSTVGRVDVRRQCEETACFLQPLADLWELVDCGAEMIDLSHKYAKGG
jgi:hypothetical protein